MFNCPGLFVAGLFVDDFFRQFPAFHLSLVVNRHPLIARLDTLFTNYTTCTTPRPWFAFT